MTDKQKAEEIALNAGNRGFARVESYCAAREMAEWKNKQFEEEKKDLRSLIDMLPMNENNQTIIEDLKALLS